MNDRFRFRCFDNDIQKFIVGFRLCDNYNWPNGIIEQCTGLKDKNGKLIYEGDIIKINADILCIDPLFLDEPVVVKWEDLCYFFYLPCIDDAIGHDPCYEYEVIGNIHENPELLEGKEYGKNTL